MPEAITSARGKSFASAVGAAPDRRIFPRKLHTARRTLHLRWPLVCSALLAATTAHATVRTQEVVKYYDVSGGTAAELRAQMSAKGPDHYDAYTRWYVRWRYKYRQQGGLCALSEISVDLEITTTLPRWRNQRAASPALREQWQRYLTALTTHELGHARNGADAAQAVDAALTRLPPAASCERLAAGANATGQGVLLQHNRFDADYDQTTKHGRTQGAVFP